MHPPRMDQITLKLENIRNGWSDLHYSHTQKRALAIVAIAVVAFSALYVARGNSQEIVAPAMPMTMDVSSLEITVDVAGAVTKPGVYKLAPSSRVVDALNAAGGALKGTDTSDINLARPLKDGEQIYVYPPLKGSAASSPRRTSTVHPARAAGPVLVNRASVKEFEALDGIGPVLANRIVAYRKANGPFTTVDDLLKVSGIGPSKFAQFKEKLRV